MEQDLTNALGRRAFGLRSSHDLCNSGPACSNDRISQIGSAARTQEIAAAEIDDGSIVYKIARVDDGAVVVYDVAILELRAWEVLERSIVVDCAVKIRADYKILDYSGVVQRTVIVENRAVAEIPSGQVSRLIGIAGVGGIICIVPDDLERSVVVYGSSARHEVSVVITYKSSVCRYQAIIIDDSLLTKCILEINCAVVYYRAIIFKPESRIV